jgi:prefoldin subunit 5
MNADRRKKIAALMTDLDELRASIEDGSVTGAIQEVLDDEQNAYDNMPEGMRDGERGEKAQAAIDALQSAIDAIGQAMDDLHEAYGSLETATE